MVAQQIQAVGALTECQRKLASVHTTESTMISVLISRTIAPLRMDKSVPTEIIRHAIQKIRRSHISDEQLKRVMINNLSMLLQAHDV